RGTGVARGNHELDDALDPRGEGQRKIRDHSHSSSTNSALTPGPSAKSRPCDAGGGCVASTSASTCSTEADERFPTRSSERQLGSNMEVGSSSELANASSTRGPPGCATHWSMSATVSELSARNPVTSTGKYRSITSATPAPSTISKPLERMFHPMPSRVSG